MSPISYYDSRHYGAYFGLFEAALCFFIAIVLFRQFKHTGVRVALGLAMVMYVAVPAYFILIFG